MTAIVPRDRADKARSMVELKPSFIYRVAAAYQMIRGGRMPDWFGPGAPLPEQAPESVKGRQFDYPVNFNADTVQPKTFEGVDYATLRNLADNLDILRIVIESIKEQIVKLEWQIVKRGDDNKKGAVEGADPTAEQLTNFFRYPDSDAHDWATWLRMWLEDVLVIDTYCLWPLMDGKSLINLDSIDPATIKRIIDDSGRTPVAPTPAYQQILHGIPANAYTRDELIYKIRNPRTWKAYGYSPVEQIMVTINIALRRQISQLQYYTDGSVPDTILSVPEGWTPDQIAQFKTWWDSILRGNTAERRGTMFVFNGTKPYATKDKVLTDKMEDWLARVVCFAFRVSPQPFVSAFNRATAEASKEQAKEDGIGALMTWLKLQFDSMIAKQCGQPNYEFRWKEEDETDPLTKAKINDLKIKNGTKRINEARAEDGQDPVQGGDTLLLFTPGGVVRLSDVVNAPAEVLATPQQNTAQGDIFAQQGGKPAGKPTPKAPQNTASKLAKVAPSGVSMVRLTALARSVLAKLRHSVLKQVLTLLGKVNEGDIVDRLDLSDFSEMTEELVDELMKALAEGWQAGMLEQNANVTFDNQVAADWASQHAADLLGNGGVLADSTRVFIRELVAKAIREQWTPEVLADQLQNAYAFSDTRARTIADTELSTAMIKGNLDAWKALGVEGKSWLTAADETVCQVCVDNQGDGVIPLDQPFSSGDQGPPAHPNCHCDVRGHSKIGE